MDADTREFVKMLAGALVLGTVKLFAGLVFGYRLPLLFFTFVAVVVWGFK